MRIVLILILLLFFNCSSNKNVTSNSDINVGYIREIITYSNFKNFLNRDLKRKSIVDTIAYGSNNKLETIEVHKYYYPKQKELVYIEYIKKSDIYVNQKFYYRDNELVFIRSNISINTKDTILNRIFVKDNAIYRNYNASRDSTYLLNKGLNYITKFNFTA